MKTQFRSLSTFSALIAMVVLGASCSLAGNNVLTQGKLALHFGQFQKARQIQPDLVAQVVDVKIDLTMGATTVSKVVPIADLNSSAGLVSFVDLSAGQWSLLAVGRNYLGDPIVWSDHTAYSITITGGGDATSVNVLLKGKKSTGVNGHFDLALTWPLTSADSMKFDIYLQATPVATRVYTGSSAVETFSLPSGAYRVSINFLIGGQPQFTALNYMFEVWDNATTDLHQTLVASMFNDAPGIPGPPGAGLVAFEPHWGANSYVYLHWTPPTTGGGATGYTIERSQDGGVTWVLLPNPLGVSGYDDNAGAGLLQSQVYEYRIAAVNPFGKSPYLTISGTSARAPKTFYVGLTGSDSNVGDTTLAPFATLAKAMTATVAGDTVRVEAGNHALSQPLDLIAGVSLLGGFDPTFVTVTGQTTLVPAFAVAGPTVLATNLGPASQPTVLHSFNILPVTTGWATGAMAVAVDVQNSHGLEFTAVSITPPSSPADNTLKSIGLNLVDSDIKLLPNGALRGKIILPTNPVATLTGIAGTWSGASTATASEFLSQDFLFDSAVVVTGSYTIMDLTNPVNNSKVIDDNFKSINLAGVTATLGKVTALRVKHNQPGVVNLEVARNLFLHPVDPSNGTGAELAVFDGGIVAAGNELTLNISGNRFYNQSDFPIQTRELTLVGNVNAIVESNIFSAKVNGSNDLIYLDQAANAVVTNNGFSKNNMGAAITFNLCSPVVRNNIFNGAVGSYTAIEALSSSRLGELRNNFFNGVGSVKLFGGPVYSNQLDINDETKVLQVATAGLASNNVVKATAAALNADAYQAKIVAPADVAGYLYFAGTYGGGYNVDVNGNARSGSYNSVGPFEYPELDALSGIGGNISLGTGFGSTVNTWNYTSATLPTYTHDRTGSVSSAADLNGTQDLAYQLASPSPEFYTGVGFSVSFWVGRALPTNDTTRRWLWGTKGAAGYIGLVMVGNSQLQLIKNDVVLRTSVGGDGLFIQPWNHIALVWDNANDNVNVYVNGVAENPDNQHALAYSWTDDVDDFTPDFTGGYNSGIGKAPIAFTPNPALAITGFDGKLDDLKTWNHPLSQTDVVGLATDNGGWTKYPHSSFLRSAFLFENAHGATTYQSSDLDQKGGTLAVGGVGSITPTTNRAGEANSALNFANAYLAINNTWPNFYNDNILNNSSSSATISFWIYGNTSTGPIICWSSGAGNRGYHFDTAAGSITPYSIDITNGSTGAGSAVALTGLNLASGVWNHVALVWTFGAAGTITSYVNGALIGTQSLGIPNGLNYDSGITELRIGGSPAGGNFTGQLDDVRLYNTALTQAEITTLAKDN